MKKPEIVTVAESKLPAVKAFLTQQERLEAWKTKHAAALLELRAIAAVYNPSLKAAHSAVKAARVRCGPFELYQWQTKYDADALYEAVGRSRFAASGGKIEPEWKSVDDVLFDSLVALKKLPAALVAKVVSFGPKFHAPDEIVIP